MTGKPRYVKTVVNLGKYSASVYAGCRIASALQELTEEMTLYHGVRLQQVLKAVYEQGKKDGARSVFDSVDTIKGKIPHRNPGKPRKSRAK